VEEQKAESGGSGNSFEDAAAKVSEPEKPAAVSQADEPEPKEEKFVIDDDVTIWTVQAVFWPLKTYDHPAWEVTDEEAAFVSPKLQPFLQKFFDRYIPDWMGRYASKNKELAELVIAFGMLFVIKRNQVIRLKKVDAMIEAQKVKEKKADSVPLYVVERPKPEGETS